MSKKDCKNKLKEAQEHIRSAVALFEDVVKDESAPEKARVRAKCIVKAIQIDEEEVSRILKEMDSK